MRSDRPVGGAFHTVCAALLLLTCATAYSNTLNSPFTFDDGPNIEQNEWIRVERLDAQSLWSAGFESQSLRPIAYMSFALNYYFGGYDVRGYHIVNLIIHWLAGVWVYWLASDLFRRQRALGGGAVGSRGLSDFLPAFLAAAIFVAHPIQTQAVTYIVQRMGSMATMFYLLAFVLFICGRDRDGGKRWSLWVGSAACWMLALGSKQTAITFPLLVFLYEWYFFRDLRLDWLKQRLPLAFGVALGLACLAGLFLTDTAFDYRHREFSLGERLLTQSRVIIAYLGLLVCPLPSRLNLTHDISVSHSLIDPPTTLFSILAILALLVLSIRMARSQRLLSFCILWFFINLSIESSFVALEMMFEHRLYLPMLAFSVLVANGFRLASGRRGVWGAAISVGLVVALGLGSYERNKAWRDELTLWSDVVAKSPGDFRAHSNLGKAFRGVGKLDEAAAHLNRSIELDGNFFPPRWNLAGVAMDRGNRLEAIEHLRGALAVDAWDARAYPYFAKAHRAIAKLLVVEGEWREAREHSSEALRRDPDRPVSMMRHAWILITDPDRSAADLTQAIELAERADALTQHAAHRVLDTLASAYAAAGRFDDAIEVVRELLEIDLAEEGTRVARLRARLEKYQRAAQNRPDAGPELAPNSIDAPPSFTDSERIR